MLKLVNSLIRGINEKQKKHLEDITRVVETVKDEVKVAQHEYFKLIEDAG